MSTLLSNKEVLAVLGLPSDVITNLQSNAQETYEPASNKFLNGLVNKITKQQVAVTKFTNPFTLFDKDPLAFGDTIENVRIDVSKGTPYAETTDDPFARTKPVAKGRYITDNFEYQWASTIEQKELAKACLASNGFMQISDAIVESMNTARNIEEYNAEITYLNKADLYANGIESIATKAVEADEKKKAKLITKTLAKALKDMTFPATDNNAMKVMNVSKFDDLYVIIKEDVLQDINFDFLEGVFNLSKIELAKHFIEIRSFQTIKNTKDDSTSAVTPSVTGDDLAFVILDKNGFDNHVMLDIGTSIYNPKKHYTNMFHTLWKIFNYRNDFNARAFKIDSTK